MAQRTALALAFALALAGSSALAAGWRTPTVAQVPQALPSGHWTLWDGRILHWTIDPSDPQVPTSWYEEHSRQIQQIQQDIDCQISACGQR